MKLYAPLGYVIIVSPLLHNDNGQYKGQCIDNAGKIDRVALYFMGSGTRVFEIDGFVHHAVPLSNVLAFWDFSCPDE